MLPGKKKKKKPPFDKNVFYVCFQPISFEKENQQGA